MAHHIDPSNATNKTINAIDRKRQRERRFMLIKARDHARELASSLVQRLIDRHIIETSAVEPLVETLEQQLVRLHDMEEFDIQFKIAPIRTLTPDPNFISLYITQYIVEDLIDHPKIGDIFGDDLDVYQAVESVLGRIRPH